MYINKNYSGVSLVVLIITIIVMIILASTVIISLDSNIISKTSDTVLKSDIQTMIDNYKAIYDNVLYDYQGDESLITDSDFANKNIIPEKYESKFSVSKDGIKYIGADAREKEIAKTMGVIVD